MKPKPISKEMELSIKALWAAIFMATIFIYLVIGFIVRLLNIENFYHHIPFEFLIQGLIMSMVGSSTWILSFGHDKTWSFITRYLLPLVILAVSFGISMLIPIINSTEWYLFWLISGLLSSLAFGTAIAVLSENHLKKTGKRSVLLWKL